MYEAFFGLSARAFADRPDPDFFVESDAHAAALRTIRDGLDTGQPLLVMTGEAGCGKTMLARTLIAGLDETIAVGLITNTHASVEDLTRWTLLSFGQETVARSDTELQEALALYFVSEFGAGRKCLLVVDEAQNISPIALAGLQQYLDINSEGDCLLQVLLVGEPRLLRTLHQPVVAAWEDRPPLISRVSALPLEDVPDYVGTRLAVAGARHAIFTNEAVAAVAIASGGVPRLINAICDMALVYAFARRSKEIDRDLIVDVVSEGRVTGFGVLAMLSPIDAQEPSIGALASDQPAPIAPAPELDVTALEPAPPEVISSRIVASEIVASEMAPADLAASGAPELAVAEASSVSERIPAASQDPAAPPEPPQVQIQIAYTQPFAGWPSITGRNNVGRFARSGSLDAGPATGTALRRRFLPRN
jgi:type II secretory pathway predicted ATPase ExeA